MASKFIVVSNNAPIRKTFLVLDARQNRIISVKDAITGNIYISFTIKFKTTTGIVNDSKQNNIESSCSTNCILWNTQYQILSEVLKDISGSDFEQKKQNLMP